VAWATSILREEKEEGMTVAARAGPGERPPIGNILGTILSQMEPETGTNTLLKTCESINIFYGTPCQKFYKFLSEKAGLPHKNFYKIFQDKKKYLPRNFYKKNFFSRPQYLIRNFIKDF